MSPDHKSAPRRYNAPRRAAAALRTREAIVRAAKSSFERSGWSATTIQAIASAAGVSPKTVEALFGTKAVLLRTVVDYSIRGDLFDIPVTQREGGARIEAAPTAAAMLDLHASHVRSIVERTAGIAWSVEHAAAADPDVAALWQKMTRNRRSGVTWATDALLAKPDVDKTLERADVESTFWLALEWGTYRTMTEQHGLTPEQFEGWLRNYYRNMLHS
ncbi:MAG TPA: helix-turn-helix domain-containing protein [Gaiellaceae bacterium]|jgi:AcrR family transcriptional regulator|nr:helix-turn-helix domain-containing protein [Gaiellaceae bacterium]